MGGGIIGEGIIGAAIIGEPRDVEPSIGLIEEACVGIAPAIPCPPNDMEPPNIEIADN